MTKETIIHRERAALLAVYEAAAEFIRDRNKGDFQLPELAGYDADALEQKLCEASQVIIRDMPPYVPAIHAHVPKPKPPLGLRPLDIALRERLSEIADASCRYREAAKEIPQEWCREGWGIYLQLGNKLTP